MVELIKASQLDIMLLLCGACGILSFLLLNTRFLSRRRKAVLILMEAVAFFLLLFDRMSYLYAGVTGHKAYIMVRISNFAVFFLTSAAVFCFNMYLTDLLVTEGKLSAQPERLRIAGMLSVAGMLLSVIAAFTNLYYYFDEANVYHRGHGFLIAYIIPILAPVIQFTVIRGYKEYFSKLIYLSLVLFIFVPVVCGILQIFTYGISIVNMSMVAVSIFLYIFMYLDLNNQVVHGHEIEVRHLKSEHQRMQRVFDQTAMAFVSAVERKDDLSRGNAVKTAEYARRIAFLAGKGPRECEKAYYAALLHDVGLVGIPDSVIKLNTKPEKTEDEIMKQKPLIGAEILEGIKEYPYLSQGARYSHERYNGSGYPEGLKGKEIPEIARVIGVADAYVNMTSGKHYRDAMPAFMVREAFIKGAGEEFDPEFAAAMVKIMDSGDGEEAREPAEELEKELEKELVIKEYRELTSSGIPLDRRVKRIRFAAESAVEAGSVFSAPSIILFDAYDGRVHDGVREVEQYDYLEYAEVWFDEHSVTTAARVIEEKRIPGTDAGRSPDGKPLYEIIAGRYEDHLKLLMKGEDGAKEVIVALPGGSRYSFLALTGENCALSGISAEETGETFGDGDIPRIAEPVSYIEHFESDLKNVQIDQTRSASTEGVEIKKRLIISFHTMSLPVSSLVWHCPYVVLFTSDDGRVGGENYKEFDVIKLDGENEGNTEYADNSFVMKKTEDFPGWDAWKEANKAGLNCVVSLFRKGNQIVLKTENLGIRIENTTTVKEEHGKVYAALTGDEVALTDIRIQ